jgi:hypothetical protein
MLSRTPGWLAGSAILSAARTRSWLVQRLALSTAQNHAECQGAAPSLTHSTARHQSSRKLAADSKASRFLHRRRPWPCPRRKPEYAPLRRSSSMASPSQEAGRARRPCHKELSICSYRSGNRPASWTPLVSARRSAWFCSALGASRWTSQLRVRAADERAEPASQASASPRHVSKIKRRGASLGQ